MIFADNDKWSATFFFLLQSLFLQAYRKDISKSRDMRQLLAKESPIKFELCLLSRQKIAYSIRNVEIGTYMHYV